MKRRSYGGLLALNAVLLAALGFVAFAPGAAGQSSASRRPRGEYTMVGGLVQGFSESAIYVIDSTNQELIALRWDRSAKSLKGIGFRDLAADARRNDGRPR